MAAKARPSSAVTDREFLRAFGERVRAERARRGMSRKLLADHADMSERYIAQIESGKGNISVLLLRQLAAALGLPVTRLVEEESPTAEMTLIRQFLSRLSPAQLKEAHVSLTSRFASDAAALRSQRIAFVGLRGAGKTTLGAAVAKARGLPFVELDREVERLAGATLAVIVELYGQPAYRRYEMQALQQILESRIEFVLAAGGGIVSEPGTYESLLRHCFTVWIRATPEEHMSRVIAQGDRRPMAGSSQAMEDLRRILEERTPLYARADLIIDTAGKKEVETVRELLKKLP